jgi:ribosomal protein L40E
MVDPSISTETPTVAVCPWCSAQLAPDASVCASCGANLTSDEEHELPGVTAVDQDVLRGVKKNAVGRSRILSWISGEYEPEGHSEVEAGALRPPDLDVQREILRLQLEAEVANLQAEADARYAEAVVEGRVSDLPEGVQEMATGSTLDEVMAALEGSTGTTNDAPETDEAAAPVAADEEAPAS